MMLALKVDHLAKTYTTRASLLGSRSAGVHAIRPMSFNVKSGETLGVVGESGCGKSTLARMLVGLLAPTMGTIEIEGQVLNKVKPAERGKLIQYVFQDPGSSLNPRKTIRQILEAPLKRLYRMNKAERQKHVAQIVASVNLREAFLERYPHEFSGGQAQRIALARALAARAKIIILDEPVSALDVSVQAQVLNLLGNLRDRFGLTYLFISHDLAVVEAISDRIMVLYFGSVVEIGKAESIFTTPRHPYTKLLAESAPLIGRKLSAPEQKETELPDPLNPPAGCSFAGRCRFATALCYTQVPELKPMGVDQLAACHHPLKT